MNSNAKLDRVRTIIKQISPLLAGQDPKLVGAVLAGLTAMWVAGRVSPGNPEETEQVLARHIAGVRSLIGIDPDYDEERAGNPNFANRG